MIKSLLSTALLLMLTLCASAQKPFTIKGSQAKDVATTKYLIYMADENFKYRTTAKDSIIVKKGKILYSKDVKQPVPAMIIKTDAHGNRTNSYFLTLLIPGATMNMNVTNEGIKLGGATFYKQCQNMKDVIAPAKNALQEVVSRAIALSTDKNIQNRDSVLRVLNNEYLERTKDYMNAVQDYYDKHKAEDGCVVSLVQELLDEKYYNDADASVKNGMFKDFLERYTAQMRKERADREAQENSAKESASKTACGQMFTDFEAEYDGKIQKLSDYVGRGKYVLVDFWASWCGPCRAEIPNLIKVYNQYKGDRFEVLGVATWDKPEDTLKAIGQMGIPYPQIINAQQAGSKAYGITGIPQIILFGPDGTILKRDLRGEDVNAAVEDVLKQ